jgi:hypothetical protein
VAIEYNADNGSRNQNKKNSIEGLRVSCLYVE